MRTGLFGARAEKEQVTGQTFGHVVVTAHAGTQLRQQARGHALGVNVAVKQPTALRVEEGRRQAPDSGRQRGARARTELGAKVAHALHRRAVRAAHERQHQRLHAVARAVVGAARGQPGFTWQLLPAPVLAPEVGRMDAVAASELRHGTVLREQGDAGNRPARQAALQIVKNGKGGRLDGLNRRQVHQLGFARQALDSRFAAAQHARRDAQANELQRPHTLVQLHTRGAQDGGVGAVNVRHANRLRLFEIPPQRLVRGIERALQLAGDPGQGAEVVAAMRGRLGRHVGWRVG